MAHTCNPCVTTLTQAREGTAIESIRYTSDPSIFEDEMDEVRLFVYKI
jgi:hypothetical protein